MSHCTTDMLRCRTAELTSLERFLLIFHFWVHIIFLLIQKPAVKTGETATLNRPCKECVCPCVCVCVTEIPVCAQVPAIITVNISK